jgi:hypothetical protein
MIHPFEFYEQFEDQQIYTQYPNLKINDSPAFYLLLRGIIGTIKIKQTFRDVTFNQTVDLLKPTMARASVVSETDNQEVAGDLSFAISGMLQILRTRCKPDIEVLPKYIADSFTLSDLSELLANRALIHRNKVFFESLNNEYCNFYYHTNNKSHTVAFLHLYRILEYVSYSFPLMYAASSKDFSKSFEALKGLFTGEKDQGELKVFKYFISNVMSTEQDYERLTIDINVTAPLEEYNERIYKTIIRICDKTIFEDGRNIENSKLCIKFAEFSSFIITIRNRFFHLKNSQDINITSVDVVDSDHFFHTINSQCAYFLSLVTFVIIKKSYFQA